MLMFLAVIETFKPDVIFAANLMALYSAESTLTTPAEWDERRKTFSFTRCRQHKQ